MTMTLAQANNKLRKWFPLGSPKVFDFDAINMWFEFPKDKGRGNPKRKAYRITKHELLDRGDDNAPDLSSLLCT